MSTLAMIFGRVTATWMIWRKGCAAAGVRSVAVVEASPGKILQNQLTYPLEYPNEY